MNNDDEKYSVNDVPIDNDEKRQKEQDVFP